MKKTKITQKEAKAHGIQMSHLKEYNVFYKLENGDIVDIDGEIRYKNKDKIKLLYKTPKNKIEYGLIGIETRIGELEYSYQTGVDYDANYQLETILSNYHELTNKELDEIDEIISNEIK